MSEQNDQNTQTVTLQLDDEARAQITALQEELQQTRAERERAEAAAIENANAIKAANERIATMEASARQKRYTDLVMGRGDGNDGRRWFGNTESHVRLMDRLAGAFGEDSDEFKQYVEQNRAHAEQLHTSGLFKEVGRDASGSAQSADGQLQALARQAREANPTLTEAQAYDQASKQRPDLLERAVRGE